MFSPPFSVAGSEYDFGTYCLNNPFVEVVLEPGVRILEETDKVRHAMKNPMDLEPLTRIISEAMRDSIELRMLSARRRGSPASCGWAACMEAGFHISLLRPLAKFTQKQGKEETEAEEPHEGLYIQEYLGSEEAKTLQVSVPDITSADGLLVALVKCNKYDYGLDDAVFQAGFYAKGGAVQNMRQGKYSPIYLYVFARTKWKYGMLVPYGIVTVKDGRVKSIQSTNVGDTREFLETSLLEATIALRKKHCEHRTYPDGDYLSGVLYRDDKEYDLAGEDCRPRDMALFYQSWLQIVVGNEVSDWTVEEVEARLEARKYEIRRKCVAIGDALRNLG